MHKRLISKQYLFCLLQPRQLSSLLPVSKHGLRAKSTARTASVVTEPSAYWSLLLQDPRNFSFDKSSSIKAVSDPSFMRQLFLHSTKQDNLSDIYTSQCCDLYQSLDTPDQLVYLGHLGDPHSCSSTSSFLHRLYQLPDGIKRLIDFRASLLSLLQQYPSHQSTLSPLETYLKSTIKEALSGTKGSALSMRRITWQSSTPEIIDKLCRYEAVHAVTSLQDIKRRLALDRRVYALFAQNLPREPLVFVHVALASELSSSIQSILQPSVSSPSSSSLKYAYAICYSITTQKGLGGIHLGNYLIRQVVDQLQLAFPELHTFATLSPIPGFRHWLLNQTSEHPDISEQLVKAGGTHWKENVINVAKDSPLASVLLRLCARYLLNEKRTNHYAIDPVANFHLRNGACAHQLQWMGDTSDKGISESFGMMVNYNYIPSRLDDHHQQYIDHGTVFVSEHSSSSTPTKGTSMLVPPSWLSDCAGPNVIKLR